MSLSNPYSVDAPASVYVASGALGARSLLDTTRVFGCSVIWPISPDSNVATSKGRVQTLLRRGTGPWLALQDERGDVDRTRFEPVYVDEVLQAQARYVNNAGIASAWTLSPPHRVVDSEVGEVLVSLSSRRQGWPGILTGGAQVTPPPGLLAFHESRTDGFENFSGAKEVSGNLMQTQVMFSSLVDGWNGTITGAVATLIASGAAPSAGTASLDFSKASNSMYLPLIL